jgi:hypothetical protein
MYTIRQPGCPCTRQIQLRLLDTLSCATPGAGLAKGFSPEAQFVAGFVPQEHIRRLQDYQRLRADHIAEAASCEQPMQKALERMKIKLHDVISDLTGKRRGSQKRFRNRAGRLFCLIARAVGRTSDKALGGFYRRLRARRGGLAANLALARKMAQMFWWAMVHGLAYVEQGIKKHEDKVQKTEQAWLRKLARRAADPGRVRRMGDLPALRAIVHRPHGQILRRHDADAQGRDVRHRALLQCPPLAAVARDLTALTRRQVCPPSECADYSAPFDRFLARPRREHTNHRRPGAV